MCTPAGTSRHTCEAFVAPPLLTPPPPPREEHLTRGAAPGTTGTVSPTLICISPSVGTAIIIYVFMSDEEDDLPPEYATATVEVRERARERIEKAKIIRTID